jgi:hypothetical protein
MADLAVRTSEPLVIAEEGPTTSEDLTLLAPGRQQRETLHLTDTIYGAALGAPTDRSAGLQEAPLSIAEELTPQLVLVGLEVDFAVLRRTRVRRRG